jgi:hypothetical protein
MGTSPSEVTSDNNIHHKQTVLMSVGTAVLHTALQANTAVAAQLVCSRSPNNEVDRVCTKQQHAGHHACQTTWLLSPAAS